MSFHLRWWAIRQKQWYVDVAICFGGASAQAVNSEVSILATEVPRHQVHITCNKYILCPISRTFKGIYLTYPCYLNPSSQMSSSFYLGIMYSSQYLPNIRCERNQHLRAFSTHRHQSDWRFRICLGFGLKNECDSISLSSETGWSGSGILSATSSTLIRTIQRTV